MIKCQEPPVPLNSLRPRGSFMRGDVITLKCQLGHHPLGDLTTKCDHDGSWTQPQGYCTSKLILLNFAMHCLWSTKTHLTSMNRIPDLIGVITVVRPKLESCPCLEGYISYSFEFGNQAFCAARYRIYSNWKHPVRRPNFEDCLFLKNQMTNTLLVLYHEYNLRL